MYERRSIEEIKSEIAAQQSFGDEVSPDLLDELARAEARAAGTLVVSPADPRLVSYELHFASGQAYRFWAEDAEHALEQAHDAEPGETVVEIVLAAGRRD